MDMGFLTFLEPVLKLIAIANRFSMTTLMTVLATDSIQKLFSNATLTFIFQTVYR